MLSSTLLNLLSFDWHHSMPWEPPYGWFSWHDGRYWWYWENQWWQWMSVWSHDIGLLDVWVLSTQPPAPPLTINEGGAALTSLVCSTSNSSSTSDSSTEVRDVEFVEKMCCIMASIDG